MLKTSIAIQACLAGILLLLTASAAKAQAPSVTRVTAIIGKADRGRSATRHPVVVAVKVEGTNLGSVESASEISLTGWNPRYQEVRQIARRIKSGLKHRPHGNEVAVWNTTADPYVLVVFDVGRYFREDALNSTFFGTTADLVDHVADLRVELKTPNGTSGPKPVNVAMRYDRWPLDQPGEPYRGQGPIVLAPGDNGDVYVGYELSDTGFSVWRAPDGPVEDIVVPATENPPPFAEGGTTPEYTYYGDVQDAAFGAGRAWFGQSGNWGYGGPLDSQSRVVSYDPVTEQVKKYIVARDDQPIMGVLHDPYRNRIWYSIGDTLSAYPNGIQCEGGFLPFDWFDPDFDPYCPERGASIGSLDLNNLVEEDFNAIPQPIRLRRSNLNSNTSLPIKMTIDDTPEHNLWFNAGGGRFIGRIHLTQGCLDDPSTCVIDHYRVPQVRPGNEYFDILGWSIDTAPDGDIVFSAEFETILGKFDISRADDPLCKSEEFYGAGDVDEPNPCMTILHVPLAPDPPSQLLHTMAQDEDRCLLWYSYWTGSGLKKIKHFSVGYAPLDLSAPATTVPGLYTFEEHYYVKLERTSETGITVSADGSVFFSEYYRRELGRLQPVAGYFPGCAP